jgi:hypothetical protein
MHRKDKRLCLVNTKWRMNERSSRKNLLMVGYVNCKGWNISRYFFHYHFEWWDDVVWWTIYIMRPNMFRLRVFTMISWIGNKRMGNEYFLS